MKTEWKFRELIAALGGVACVAELIDRRGFGQLSPDTVKGWQTRNSIPSKYLPLLLMVAFETRKIRSLRQLIHK